MPYRKKELAFNEPLIRKSMTVALALKDEVRQSILKLLQAEGRQPLTEIYKKLLLDKTETLAHLALLQQTEIVYAVTDGDLTCYAINYQRLETVAELIAGL